MEARIIASSPYLRSIKRRFVIGLNLISGLGCAVAAWQVLTQGIKPWEIIAFLVMYALTGVGISVGFHRLFAHRAFETVPWIRAILGVLGAMAGHGPVISWTATHRCHHMYSDESNDPHSPHVGGPAIRNRLGGLWHAHMGWLLNGDLPNSSVFAKDLIRDPLARKLNEFYVAWILLGLALPALVGGLVSGSPEGAWHGLVWGGFVRLFLGFHATCSINSLSHCFGRRRFKTGEASTNLGLLAVLTFGEGWHNNHHAFPYSARFGHTWWQIDMGFLIIQLLQTLGLAWNVKLPASPAAVGD